MATAHPQPASAGAAHPGAATAERAPAGEAVHALVAAPQQSEEGPVFSAPIPQLPVELDVTIPVREFRVRQLLALAPGQVRVAAVRADKVAAVQAALAAGTYSVPASAVASRVIDSMLTAGLARGQS